MINDDRFKEKKVKRNVLVPNVQTAKKLQESCEQELTALVRDNLSLPLNVWWEEGVFVHSIPLVLIYCLSALYGLCDNVHHIL